MDDWPASKREAGPGHLGTATGRRTPTWLQTWCHAAESVAFLRSLGIDLDQARASGVSSAAFAAKLAAVLSASATPQRGQLTWVAFGGAYDFAYMVKMLTGVQAKAVLGGG